MKNIKKKRKKITVTEKFAADTGARGGYANSYQSCKKPEKGGGGAGERRQP